MSKVESLVRNFPNVDSISDERDLESGIWVYPKRGFRFVSDSCAPHTLHENSWSALWKELRKGIVSCDCGHC